MTTTASYGQPLGVLPSINAGPSLRPYSNNNNSPARLQKMEQAQQKAPTAKASASSSPAKKKINMKKTRLPEVGPTIKDIENGVVHVTGKLLGQVCTIEAANQRR